MTNGKAIMADPSKPGYVPDLHERDIDHRDTCAQCGEPFPCHGAFRQYKEASRFTNSVWLDETRFATLQKQRGMGG